MASKGKGAGPASQWIPLPDTASIMQVPTVPGIDDMTVKPEQLSLQDLNYVITFVDQSNKTLEVENAVLERYLQRMDPSLIAKMEQILEAAAAAVLKAERAAQLGAAASSLSLLHSRRGTDESICSSPRTTLSNRTYSHTGISKLTNLTGTDKGPRVQPSQKIDIINREIDDLKNNLEITRDEAKHFNYIMRCRNEELTLRMQEMVEAKETFEQNMVKGAVDPHTGKIPGEKFLRYLETRLTTLDRQLAKIHMKTSSIKVQLSILNKQLAQKSDLGEILHAVDFEQMEIENKNLKEKYDEKAIQIIEMKKNYGKCANDLNHNKNIMQEKFKGMKNLNTHIKYNEAALKQLLEAESHVTEDLEEAQRDVEKITKLIKKYTVPDVMEYVQQRSQLNDLKKAVKVWGRKNKLQELSVANKMRQMKKDSKGQPGAVKSKQTHAKSKFH